MSEAQERQFQRSDRPEVAMITNHGYAGAEIPIGGAPDTGGQVVYVNAFAEALDALGYRVTIFARGGFPHFRGEGIRREPEYLTDHVRYVFVPGGGDVFLPKEDIAVALDEEVSWLENFVDNEAAARDRPPWDQYEFLSTHYWDAAVMGVRLVERWRNNVAAEAITDLLTGSIPAEVVNRMRDERHWRALGEAPAYHLGALLLENVGPPATPLSQRVRDAATRWADAAWQARSYDAGKIVKAVEEAISIAKDDDAPALHPVAAAQAMGDAILALCPGRAELLTRELEAVDRHVWTPHSLGAIKEENLRSQSPELLRDLKFCERRNHERAVCDRTPVVLATSTEVAECLRIHYRVPEERTFYFPPCVNRSQFRKYAEDEVEATYQYLSKVSGVRIEELKSGQILFETSRMDPTKRKDLLLQAFAQVAPVVENTYLFIGGGPKNDLFQELTATLAATPELQGRAFLTGFIPEEHIGPVFSIADIYVSTSEMEGFGMSISQAAAAGSAIVSTDLVPFAVHYVPEDAMIVPAGDVEGIVDAILRLLQDDADRRRRAANLVEKVKTLDWTARTSALLEFLRRKGMIGAASEDSA